MVRRVSLIWIQIETGGKLLWRRYWTYRFHNKPGITWPAYKLSASQVWLRSVGV